ncbi:HlyC/CorC family transporter [Burkholderiaceae bacterium FT117]|uniref:HlyC/CorC family transporter n=1 Tax=Zeimonas sediminis TaxID=2944268 RepID=UPI00234313BF|nr:HlyC/CorC family transporter [Zeimonas sediminis]MCM5570763.1 HlyC/CorC family transporter [Zeimonas sediminis]
MESFPLWLQLLLLILLLLASAFFSIAETSMMALSRFRLGHLVRQGRRSARITAGLLGQTDRLLGTILLGNNVANTALTAIVTALAIRYFGDDDRVILIATTVVAVMLIVFCEITPKVIGATHPERVALPASYVLRGLMPLFSPVVWTINLFVGRLLALAGVRPSEPREQTLSLDELRTIVLESGRFMPHKHRSILLNLFDLERISVDDVMVPRHRVEALDLATEERGIREQLSTCYHNKIPVYEGEINRVVGILHVRRALGLLQREAFDADDVRELLSPPYFVPSGTPVFRQLQFFQENRQRLGLVVDEYGEVLGLVTLEDIVEEVIGEFTTTAPGGETGQAWTDDEVVVEGTASLRDLNRRLGTQFPVDGPRTLNGLLLDVLQELPEAPVSVRFGNLAVEIQQIEDRVIRSARLRRLPH